MAARYPPVPIGYLTNIDDVLNARLDADANDYLQSIAEQMTAFRQRHMNAGPVNSHELHSVRNPKKGQNWWQRLRGRSTKPGASGHLSHTMTRQPQTSNNSQSRRTNGHENIHPRRGELQYIGNTNRNVAVRDHSEHRARRAQQDDDRLAMERNLIFAGMERGSISELMKELEDNEAASEPSIAVSEPSSEPTMSHYFTDPNASTLSADDYDDLLLADIGLDSEIPELMITSPSSAGAPFSPDPSARSWQMENEVFASNNFLEPPQIEHRRPERHHRRTHSAPMTFPTGEHRLSGRRASSISSQMLQAFADNDPHVRKAVFKRITTSIKAKFMGAKRKAQPWRSQPLRRQQDLGIDRVAIRCVVAC